MSAPGQCTHCERNGLVVSHLLCYRCVGTLGDPALANARMVSFNLQRGLFDGDFAEPGEGPPPRRSVVMVELAFDSTADALDWLLAQARASSGCVAANVLQDLAPLRHR